MAHDNYLMMISMSFDEMLSEDEEETLFDHMRSCAMCADTWTRMNALDRALTAQPEIIPPPDFVSNVMMRVSTYQERRKWYPWMVATLIVLSLAGRAEFACTHPVLLPRPVSHSSDMACGRARGSGLRCRFCRRCSCRIIPHGVYPGLAYPPEP